MDIDKFNATRNTPPIIDTAVRLHELIDELHNSPVIGVDTEMDSFYCYHEKVCLVQISNQNSDWLLDPLAIDLSPLGEIFADPSHVIVFHAGTNDVPHLRKEYGFHFANLFDTYAAASILSYDQLGLAGIIEHHFKIILDKRYQRADWNIRPLPAEMAAYARYDTRFLIALREIMLKELQETGRLREAERAFRAICQTVMHERVFDPDNWVKVKGSTQAPPEAYALIRALYVWRDTQAEKADLPPFRILPDHMLLKLALTRPTSPDELFEILGSSGSARSRAASILQAVQQGIADGPINLPSRPTRQGDRLTQAQDAALKRLRAWRNKCCQETGILPDQVISNRILRAVVIGSPQNLEQLEALNVLPERKLHEYGQSLLDIIAHQPSGPVRRRRRTR